MNENNILDYLKKEKVSFKNISAFSDKPGIYTIYSNSSGLKINGYIVGKEELLYIGKTESSQRRRDANTHFKSGQTGSSTVRKTLGSLLKEELKLIPIPRNGMDKEKGRISHFSFEDHGEERLTVWMKEFLSLSFYEYDMSKKSIDMLETNIIHTAIPILNLSKNSSNPFKAYISEQRKICASIAMNKSSEIRSTSKRKIIITNIKPKQMASEGKYSDLWSSKRNEFIKALKSNTQISSIQLHEKEFQEVGNRKKYSFSLRLDNGNVVNNIRGSAVARDLDEMLRYSSHIKGLLIGRQVVIRLDSEFCLWISTN